MIYNKSVARFRVHKTTLQNYYDKMDYPKMLDFRPDFID